MEIKKSIGISFLIAVLVMGAALAKQTLDVSEMAKRLKVLERQLTDKTESIAAMKQTLSKIEDKQENSNERIQWIWEEFDYPGTPEALLQTLQEENSRIPFEGVLGGTPYFVIEEGQVLDSHYVYIPVEDGHMMGAMLLKYEFQENNAIKWKVIDGWWPSNEEN